MNLSIILTLSEETKENKKTIECLKRELLDRKDTAQILVYTNAEKQYDMKQAFHDQNVKIEVIVQKDDTPSEVYQDAKTRVTGSFVTVLNGGDTWSAGTLAVVDKNVRSFAKNGIVMLQKIMPDGETGAFSTPVDTNKAVSVQNLMTAFRCHPFYFGGTFVRADYLKAFDFMPELGMETERAFLLDTCRREMSVLFLNNCQYYSAREREGDDTFFAGIYEKAWYHESFTNFWIPYLQKLQEEYEGIPEFIQCHLMFTIKSRLDSNHNNRNKHVIEEGREEECLKLIGEVLQYVKDDIMFDYRKIPECRAVDSIKWVYGILKYGKEFRFEKHYLSGEAYYASGNVAFNKISSLKTNILFMNYEDGGLEIDGTVHPILFSMADSIYFDLNGEKYELQYNERYALEKVFGVSVYKRHSFHVSISMNRIHKMRLVCYAALGNEIIKIPFMYQSHFSRLSNAFESSYWCFGENIRYMAVNADGGIEIHIVDSKGQRRREMKLSLEMLASGNKKAWKQLAVRKAYFLMKPFMKRKPIWLYIDKIYKAGDSSEYLYRYASAQKDNIKHYYLVDKHASDYDRLKRDGYKPLVRKSLKHRLVFLMADMVVVSNSTVFAFNNYGLDNSAYIRDLVNFHVCCVQHGMSVQKIAVAQNRLRDNIRLYFCASKYELRNLSKPIYDYVGYNALRLTGVPRYDGLVNNDQKQILISPTWRMQAAVPVRTNEGEQRDYNPLFKQSTYYKVFNSLINDPRLIEGAKKYGYKIKYVLHPIVSSQADDFDKNEFVEVIPAVGDMSYEKMFCESSLMVTDFSGIQFDFAYMRKPLVYLHHKDIPQHYEEGTFFYDTMAFGEICHDNDELIELLCEYMANGCQMKEEYVRRADDFFYYNDRNNCKRIYDTMREYQETYIFPAKDKKVNCDFGGTILNYSERENCLSEIKQIIRSKQSNVQSDTIADYYYNQNLQEKTILLLGLGKSVRGNMQYILDELNHSPQFEGYRIYVRTSEETDSLVKQCIEKNVWYRTETIVSNKKYNRVIETAKYLITETFWPEAWIKKPGQIYINTWHGTPLKKMGLEKKTRYLHEDGNAQRSFIEADYLLYPNQYTKQNMLRAYKVSELMTGKVMMLGYPRTGGMLKKASQDVAELKKKLAPNGEVLYAYMPTWKDYLKVEQVVSESRELLDYLDDNLRDDQILYVNLHHFVNDSLDYSAYRHIRKFPAAVDNYELLAATEALVTDYSSVFFDYLASRKQIVLYCPDYDLYCKKRGTYMDLMELPFDKAQTKAEVLEALNRGKCYDDQNVFEQFCQYDSQENAAKLCEILTGNVPADVTIEEIPKSEKKLIYIYTDRCEKSHATQTLESLTKIYDQSRSQIYIGCERKRVNEHLSSAYPMLADNPVMGTLADPHLTTAGKVLKKLYLGNKISFSKAIEYLKYDYALTLLRMFGRTRFNLIIIYDAIDPERVISLALAQGRKWLFLNDMILDEVKSGNRFLKDALVFAIPYMEKVFVERKEQIRLAQELLGAETSMQEIGDAEALNRELETALG